jgi:hypothetical protein
MTAGRRGNGADLVELKQKSNTKKKKKKMLKGGGVWHADPILLGK